jgi:hypothetical protein
MRSIGVAWLLHTNEDIHIGVGGGRRRRRQERVHPQHTATWEIHGRSLFTGFPTKSDFSGCDTREVSYTDAFETLAPSGPACHA